MTPEQEKECERVLEWRYNTPTSVLDAACFLRRDILDTGANRMRIGKREIDLIREVVNFALYGDYNNAASDKHIIITKEDL